MVPAESAEDLYEYAPCGYLSTPDGTIIKVTATFLAWTGYRREDLVGSKRFADLLTAGGRIYHETHYAPLLSMQGSVREIAVDVVRADRSRLPVLVNSILVRTAAGDPHVIRTSIFDATDRPPEVRARARPSPGAGGALRGSGAPSCRDAAAHADPALPTADRGAGRRRGLPSRRRR